MEPTEARQSKPRGSRLTTLRKDLQRCRAVTLTGAVIGAVVATPYAFMAYTDEGLILTAWWSVTATVFLLAPPSILFLLERKK